MAYARSYMNNASIEHLLRFTINNNVTVTIASGDITLIQANAVVVGEDQHLNGAGGAATAIARAGGHAYVTAKQALKNQQTPASPLSVLWCQGGGSLPFQRVYHAVVPKKSKFHSNGQWTTDIAQLYARVCEEAEGNREMSIAAPFLGSGQAGGDVEDTVWAALDGISTFPATFLQEVLLVENNRQQAQQIVSACQEWIQLQQDENAQITMLPLGSAWDSHGGMISEPVTIDRYSCLQTSPISSWNSSFFYPGGAHFSGNRGQRKGIVHGLQKPDGGFVRGNASSLYPHNPTPYQNIVTDRMNYFTAVDPSTRGTSSNRTSSLNSLLMDPAAEMSTVVKTPVQPSQHQGAQRVNTVQVPAQGTQRAWDEGESRKLESKSGSRQGRSFGQRSSESHFSSPARQDVDESPLYPEVCWGERPSVASRAAQDLGNFNYHMEKVVRRTAERQTRAEKFRSAGATQPKAATSRSRKDLERQAGKGSSSGRHGDMGHKGQSGRVIAMDDVTTEETFKKVPIGVEDNPEVVEAPRKAVSVVRLDDDSEDEDEDGSYPQRQLRSRSDRTEPSSSHARESHQSRSLRDYSRGDREGGMPAGRMSHCVHDDVQLPGHEGFGVIVIDYVIPDGVQGPEHPQPGSPYCGCVERAFLPDTDQGRRVLGLLEEAFDRRLTFQVCEQPGGQALVEWADIPHKTCLRGPRDRGGYPDCDYLANVQDVLREQYGIE